MESYHHHFILLAAEKHCYIQIRPQMKWEETRRQRERKIPFSLMDEKEEWGIPSQYVAFRKWCQFLEPMRIQAGPASGFKYFSSSFYTETIKCVYFRYEIFSLKFAELESNPPFSVENHAYGCVFNTRHQHRLILQQRIRTECEHISQTQKDSPSNTRNDVKELPSAHPAKMRTLDFPYNTVLTRIQQLFLISFNTWLCVAHFTVLLYKTVKTHISNDRRKIS